MAKPERYGVTKLRGAFFGDDNMATIVDDKPEFKNDSGIMMKEFLLIPHSHTVKDYEMLQKPGVLSVRTPYGDAMWVAYPTYWIDERNTSRTNAWVRITCGFDGRPTRQTERDKKFTDEIDMLRRQMENLTISNVQLAEENKMLMTESKEKLQKIM